VIRVRRFGLTAASLLAVIALAACQEQRTVVVEQAQAGSVAAQGTPAVPPRPAPKRHAGAAQCEPPWGTGPFTRVGNPISTQPVPKPARALAEHVSGCGGVRFRIGPDGAPQDVDVLAEYPVGYGFGDHVKALIENSRWSPRDDLSWHYVDYTVIVPRI
jgi:hypothetical protein